MGPVILDQVAAGETPQAMAWVYHIAIADIRIAPRCAAQI
jgi:uncharacterized protein (DUF433 family)